MLFLRFALACATLVGLGLLVLASSKTQRRLNLDVDAQAPFQVSSLERSGDNHIGELIVGVAPVAYDPATGRPLSIDGLATATQDHQRFAATKRFRHSARQTLMMTSMKAVKAQRGLAKRDDEEESTETAVGELNNGSSKKKNKSKNKTHDGDGDDDAQHDGKKKKKPDKSKPDGDKPDKSTDKGDKTKPDKDPSDPSSDSTSSSSTQGGPSNSSTQDNSTATSAGCTFSDFAALLKGRDSCRHIVLDGIKVPAGATLDLNNLTAGTQVTFAGTTTFGYKEWKGPLISVADSENIVVTGTPNHVVSYQGARWWDGLGGKPAGKVKPRAFRVDGLHNSKLVGLVLKNTPMMAFSVSSCHGITFENITLDNADGIAGKKSKNGDGFDLAHSTSVLIVNNDVVTTDDCVAINSGSGINVKNNFCRFTHGLALAPLENGVIQDVVMENNRVSDGRYGLRIKSKKGESATVSNIRFVNNLLTGLTNASIELAQNYVNGAPYANEIATTSAPFTNVTFSGIKGNVVDSACKFQIACGPGACTDFKWIDSQIEGGKLPSVCKNAPKEIPCQG